LFNPFVSSGSPPVAFARADHVGRPIARRHSLTLIVSSRRPSMGRWKDDRAVCALHALSSFQRTDRSCARGARPTWFGVSSFCAGPTVRVCLASRGPSPLPERPHRMSDAARLGEPCEVT